MWYVLILLIGLAVGFAAGAMLVRLFARTAPDRQRSELEARAVAAETRAEQLAHLMEAKDKDVQTLRDDLEVARSRAVQADTRLEEAARSIEQQKRLLEQAEERLVSVFKSLSADALKSSNEDFLRLASETMKNYVDQAKGDLGKREQAIKSLVDPLAETLGKLDEQVRQIEGRRQSAYGEMRQYLESVAGTQENLQAETRKLVAALRSPRARGRWGELTLRRVVEVAGMSGHCDFVEQETADGEGGRLRPDMVIKLPGGRQVVVDAKCPMDAYLDAVAAESDQQRTDAMTRHAAQLRNHMTQLGQKRYWDQFEPTPEMVVLFVPGESFFSAALESDRDLIEIGAAKRVVLASPTTLIALLRAVSYGWQQQAAARNAEQIRDLGRELYDRIRTMTEHLADMQRHLRLTVERFNSAVGSLESRVLVSARRFRELGAGTGAEIPPLEPVDQMPREVPAEPAPPDAPPALPQG